MFNRVKEKANEKLAGLAERVDDRLDRFAIGGAGGGASRTPAPRAPGPSETLPRASATTEARPSIDPAAVKAFESVPKADLIALLAKTNSRCARFDGRVQPSSPHGWRDLALHVDDARASLRQR